jgi:hypothetical protein
MSRHSPSAAPFQPPLERALAQAHKIPTPRLIAMGLAALAAALLLFWSVAMGLIYEAKGGVQTIGRDSAPSIVAAQQIQTDLAAMAANVANAALTRGAASTQAWTAYQKAQAELSDHLVAAAQNITLGDAERKPIVTIETRLQVYEDLVGQARATLSASDAAKDAAPDRALTLIRQANLVMEDEILPAARALNDANAAALEQSWSARKAAFSRDFIGILGAGVPAMTVLAAMMRTFAARTRRRLNPLLISAALVLSLGLGWAAFGVNASAVALTHGKQDAFDSVRPIWMARAIAYGANADESFLLLDPLLKQAHALAFQSKIERLAGKGFVMSSERAQAIQYDRSVTSRSCKGDSKTAGLLGEELRNVTFPGECEAAVAAILALSNYLTVDDRIRAFEASGQRDQAIALCIGTKPGESNYVFDEFDRALERVIKINQPELERFIGEADDALRPLPFVVSLAALVSGALVFLGLRSLLLEYRA